MPKRRTGLWMMNGLTGIRLLKRSQLRLVPKVRVTGAEELKLEGADRGQRVWQREQFWLVCSGRGDERTGIGKVPASRR